MDTLRTECEKIYICISALPKLPATIKHREKWAHARLAIIGARFLALNDASPAAATALRFPYRCNADGFSLSLSHSHSAALHYVCTRMACYAVVVLPICACAFARLARESGISSARARARTEILRLWDEKLNRIPGLLRSRQTRF